MPKKQEIRQRQAEARILQYRAVADYLRTKSDASSISITNRACVESVLARGGWALVGGLWHKNGRSLNFVQAGIVEFEDQYNRLRSLHLKSVVSGISENQTSA